MRSSLMVVAAASVLVASAAFAGPAERPEAAERFAAGQRLYQEGKYAGAIEAFSAAHAVAPHPSALFNIARCHENLGARAKAMSFYQQARAAATGDKMRADIDQRIAQLSRLPVRVLVSSEPAGASVTVGGRAAPEADKTPAVVRLTPGEHVLLLERDGFHLAAQRVVVAVGKQAPVRVVLRARAQPCAAAPTCPACPSCDDKRLTDVHNLHLHAAVGGVFGFTTGRPLAAGVGVGLFASLRRLRFGLDLKFFPFEEESITPLTAGGIAYDALRPRWILLAAEGAWLFAFEHFVMQAGAAFGLSADRLNFRGRTGTGPTARTEELIREEYAFTWSLGGGIDVYATRWFSVGAHAQAGAIHGNRADRDNPGETQSNHHFPFLVLASALTFHL